MIYLFLSSSFAFTRLDFNENTISELRPKTSLVIYVFSFSCLYVCIYLLALSVTSKLRRNFEWCFLLLLSFLIWDLYFQSFTLGSSISYNQCNILTTITTTSFYKSIDHAAGWGIGTRWNIILWHSVCFLLYIHTHAHTHMFTFEYFN